MTINELLKDINDKLQTQKQKTGSPLSIITEAMLPLAIMLGDARGAYRGLKTVYKIAETDFKRAKQTELLEKNWKITDAELTRLAGQDMDLTEKYRAYEDAGEVMDRLGVIWDAYTLHLNTLKSDRNSIGNFNW